MQLPCAGVTQCNVIRLGLCLHQVLEDTDLGTSIGEGLLEEVIPILSVKAGVKACPRNKGNNFPGSEDREQRHGNIYIC